jgi:iron complex transport system substrate-binding protein
MKKRLLPILLMLLIPLSAIIAQPQGEVAGAPAAPSARVFTDSVGRSVEFSEPITRVAVSGPLAQITVFAIAPDKLVGLSSRWTREAERYIHKTYYDLPELGQLYGGRGQLNLETLLSSGAQVVIDVGEPKATIREDLDNLQKQTGIPFVHITGTLATMDDAYRKLGELLEMPDEAEALATFIRRVYDRAVEISGNVEKRSLLYCLGDQGLNVIAKGSFHAELIDLLGDNKAVVASPSSRGTGNEVDMEQLYLWNPEVIIFDASSVHNTVSSDPMWLKLDAIRAGRCYEAPFGPYNWMGSPPGVQRYLGMLWLTKILYPEVATYNLYAEVAEYFRLFYHSELTERQFDELMAGSSDLKR